MRRVSSVWSVLVGLWGEKDGRVASRIVAFRSSRVAWDSVPLVTVCAVGTSQRMITQVEA